MIRRNAKTGRRHGVVLLEFIVALMVVVILFVAAIEFLIAMTVHQTVQAAAVEAAREAAKVAAATTNDTLVGDEAEEVVEQFLLVHGLDLSANGGARIDVKLRRAGDPTITQPTAPALIRGDTTNVPSCVVPADAFFPSATQGRISVSVCVLASRNGTPVPNLLSTLGLDISSMKFEVRSLALIE